MLPLYQLIIEVNYKERLLYDIVLRILLIQMIHISNANNDVIERQYVVAINIGFSENNKINDIRHTIQIIPMVAKRINHLLLLMFV